MGRLIASALFSGFAMLCLTVCWEAYTIDPLLDPNISRVIAIGIGLVAGLAHGFIENWKRPHATRRGTLQGLLLAFGAFTLAILPATLGEILDLTWWPLASDYQLLAGAVGALLVHALYFASSHAVAHTMATIMAPGGGTEKRDGRRESKRTISSAARTGVRDMRAGEVLYF